MTVQIFSTGSTVVASTLTICIHREPSRMQVELLLVSLSCLLRRSTSQVVLCPEDGPRCDWNFADSCSTMISKGLLLHDHGPLRDNPETGGCTLCVPPGKTWSGPLPCPVCDCNENNEFRCKRVGNTVIMADEDAPSCPASEYSSSDYNVTIVADPPCTTITELEVEFNCGKEELHTSAPTQMITSNAPSLSPESTSSMSLVSSSVESSSAATNCADCWVPLFSVALVWMCL